MSLVAKFPFARIRPESMPDAEITFLQADIINTDSSGRASFRIAEA